jgi:hypothetical protein
VARKPNYDSEKRRREMDRKAKKDARREEKDARKQDGTAGDGPPLESMESEPRATPAAE